MAIGHIVDRIVLEHVALWLQRLPRNFLPGNCDTTAAAENHRLDRRKMTASSCPHRDSTTPVLRSMGVTAAGGGPRQQQPSGQARRQSR